MIVPAIGRVGPNHSSAGAVRRGDYGIVGNVDPSALETDAVIAILRLPINIADNRAAREQAQKPFAGWGFVDHLFSSGRLGSWASAGVQTSRKIRTIRIVTVDRL